jgi:ABC-type glycerol-3-phosphate transport system substrate-binding protein
MKRLWALLIIAAIIPAVVFAGGKQAAGSGTKGVTLSLFMSANHVKYPYMSKIISMYEEKTGNKIEIQAIDDTNYDSISTAKFTTGDIPDVFMHFGNSILLNYNPEKNFYDFSGAPWVSDIMDNVIPQTKVNGKVYGLPFWEASVSGVFYNKRIFEKLGIAMPKTQAEFDAACDKILAAGIQPIYCGLSDAWPVMYQYGLDPVFDSPAGETLIWRLNNNEIKFADIPQFIAMLEWYKKAATRGWFGKTFVTDTWDYSAEALGKGEAAMILVWDTWLATDFDDTAWTYKRSDFGLMPVFLGTSDQGTFEGPNVNLTLVNKNGKNLQAAIGFVEFLAASANYNEAFRGIKTGPVFKGQTTNVPSEQYTEAKELIARVGHASAAQPRIIGYSQGEGGKAILELMRGAITVQQCAKLIDDDRIATLNSFTR